MYLNGDMLAAWQFFAEAEAWGWFDIKSFAKRLYTAGWPRHVRPYNLRHSVGITLSEEGVDLSDVQAFMGHKQMATTRRHYVPVRESRMQRASERLEDRLGWAEFVAPDRGTAAKP